MAEYEHSSGDHEDKKKSAQEYEKTKKSNVQKSHSNSPEERQKKLIKGFFGEMEMSTQGVDDAHLRAIYQELNWFLQILWLRYKDYQSKEDFNTFSNQSDFNGNIIALPTLSLNSHYGEWLHKYQLTDKKPERILLAMVMALSLNDAIFFAFLDLLQKPFVSVLIGGQTQDNERRFLPTIQTLLYVLAGVDFKNQAQYQRKFRTQQSEMTKWGIEMISNQTRLTGKSEITDEWKNLLISLNPNIWQYFLGGEMPLPEDNTDLPITKLETSLTFDDLVLNRETKEALQPLINFAKNGQNFFKDAEASGNFKKGFIGLLQGPPGTGKTLIATTIGKEVGLVTYQLELAQVVSKYIGETSKNINKVFEELTRAIDHLKGEPSILFIDEADALIGKRSEVSDSKDRYANMDVSNLLQKIETFPGLIIMASNFQQNFDIAIQRRIGSIVLVPPPEADERTQLWKNYKPADLEYPTDNFARILGERFRLTGAQINNILKQIAMGVYGSDVRVLDYDLHMEAAIKSEFIKFNEVYNRPRDLMSVAQIDESTYQQQLLWERALPPKWQYNPLFLPRILSKVVVLSEAEIKDMVKMVKRRWEGGAYHDIPFNEGIEVVLRDLCAGKKLDWNEIQANIYNLFEEEKAKSKKKEEESNKGRTVQLVDLSKLKEMGKAKEEKDTATEKKKDDTPKLTEEEKAKARKAAEEKAAKEAEEKKLRKTLTPSEAEQFWHKALPAGYAYARKDMVKNMAQMYTLNKLYIMKIVEKAAKVANADENHSTKENGDIELSATYIHAGMDELAAEIGAEQAQKRPTLSKEVLNRDHFLREDLKEQRRQEKAEENKRRDYIPTWKKAPGYWANATPMGYSYSRRDLPGNLAKFYPNTSVGDMEDLMVHAAKFADKDNTKLIAYTAHILRAIEAHGLGSGN